jgi:hypothetical protein
MSAEEPFSIRANLANTCPGVVEVNTGDQISGTGDGHFNKC